MGQRIGALVLFILAAVFAFHPLADAAAPATAPVGLAWPFFVCAGLAAWVAADWRQSR